MPLEPKMVLCIGADSFALASVKHALASEGFSVLLARNGKEGLFLASNGLLIEAVVFCLETPDINVFEVARSVRRMVPTAPVILYSDAWPLGLPRFVTDFVPRSKLHELVYIIRRHTNCRGSGQQLAGRNNGGVRR